ncbi:MAG TPA: low specificity L-threonine aldolase [Acidimicrobiales bacterium]|nr:low specificity L-threonine aldolase [Acidimicrobiales bacterium]
MASNGEPQVRRRHDPSRRSFASDNYAGAHPAVLAALQAANGGHQASYGADEYTARLGDVFRTHFGEACEVFPVFNGTGANVVSLQAMTRRWDAVICSESAHINVDECGAPEKVAGLKLLSIPTDHGKLTPELVASRLTGIGDEHRAQPRVVSLTQSTELGTCYSVDELAALCEAAHRSALAVHMDGARICNAAASLGVGLGDLTTDVGVDVISFGGTKNGLMLGEAIVVVNPGAVAGIGYLRKAAMQLASKMRFISVQFEALLGGDLWLSNARRANELAARLASAAGAIPGVRITHPVEANAVFALIPTAVAARLRLRHSFHTWSESTGEVRWMTSFDTTEDDVDRFAADVAAEMAAQDERA